MSKAAGWASDVFRVDRSAFSSASGLRAGLFVSSPLLLGLATGQEGLIYTTLGALFISNTEGPLTSSAPLRVLLVACFTEPLGFWLGTLVGLTGVASIPLAGLGIFLALLTALRPRWAPVGVFTGIFLAVGVGLPGGSAPTAEVRLVYSFIGTAWGLAGVGLHRLVASRAQGGRRAAAPVPAAAATPAPAMPRPVVPLTHSEAFKHAATVGVLSALGLAIGFVLGLPRDFWIVVTIVLAVRPSIGTTLSFTSMIVIGTLAGAVAAASVTLTVTGDYILWAFLLVDAIALYATRGMNFGVTQVFVTLFIIILLNIIYPGQWELAAVRVLDVAIGGAMSVLAVYVLGLGTHGRGR